MKKAQLSIYLDPETFGSLEAFAKRHGKPKSLVAEAAIASFLSPDDSDRREAAIAKRLDRIVRVLERLERNDMVTLETIALFIRFWLTSTPALPEHSSPAARAKGAERYDRFVEALGRRLSSGSTMLKEVSIESHGAERPCEAKTTPAQANRPANPFFRYARIRSASSIVAACTMLLFCRPRQRQSPLGKIHCTAVVAASIGVLRERRRAKDAAPRRSRSRNQPGRGRTNSSQTEFITNPQSNHPDHRENSRATRSCD